MRTLFLALILFTPQWLMAGEFYLEVDNESPSKDEVFSVDVFINTSDKANVVSGSFIYNTDYFDIEKINIGNSVVSFWIERPSERQEGQVTFSGMIAGGFSSTEAKLFSLRLTPKLVGESVLEMKDLVLLAHDGLGTPLAVSSVPLSIKIDDNPVDKDYLNEEDIEAPENFTPELVQRDDWFDGKYVLVFDTTDKGSGIDSYYVKEVYFEFLAPFVSWRLVNSPYMIKDQSLRSFVFIKAQDRVGNSEVVQVVPENPRVIWPFVTIAILILLLLFLLKKKRKIQPDNNL